jgi:hypothetical protein
MSSPEQLPPDPDAALIADHGRTLVTLASASIDHGVEQARALAVDPAEFAAALREDHATFVTLTRAGELRGCTGSPRAWRPLVLDIAENAFATAFEDDRFRPLERGELGDLDITVTLLSPPAPLPTASQAGLARALRPGVDGLILEDDARRGLFLPVVWKTLPEAENFVARLKAKAGLSEDEWPAALKAHRFTACSISLSELGPEAATTARNTSS